MIEVQLQQYEETELYGLWTKANDETISKDIPQLALPKGEYARITVKPKFGFAWGLAIGEAKRHFYTKWLPSSDYQAVNLEYEYHTEKALVKIPQLVLFLQLKNMSEKS